MIAGESTACPRCPPRAVLGGRVLPRTERAAHQGRRLRQSLDLSAASRFSDYSTFGGTTNNKLGVRWQINDDLTLQHLGRRFPCPVHRRAVRFAGALRRQHHRPCNHATGPDRAELHRPGRAQSGEFRAANPQISTRTGGNSNLKPGTSTGLTAGAVWPGWASNTGWSQKLDFGATFWSTGSKERHPGPDAQTQLDRCVATNSPTFCDGIVRSA